MDFLHYRTLANVLHSRAKTLYVRIPRSYSTVDWMRWCNKTIVQRGPAPRSCIGPRICSGRPWSSWQLSALYWFNQAL